LVSGYRPQDRLRVKLYSRPGNDFTYRFPLIVETLSRLQAAPGVAQRVQAAQAEAGGRNLRTGGGKVVGMEGPPPPKRVGLTEWDSLEKAEAFFKSKAFTELPGAVKRGSRPSADMQSK
jgi:uncharacterized protein (DUF1330 family)